MSEPCPSCQSLGRLCEECSADLALLTSKSDPLGQIAAGLNRKRDPMNHGFRVVETIAGANPIHPKYPLLEGDLIVEERDGTFAKEAPGLAVGGFVLTPEQRATLRPVEFDRRGLYNTIKETK